MGARVFARQTEAARGQQPTMAPKRKYPDQPVVGVGGVVISDGRALLIRRGSEPLKGEWSIPGGTLEVGETLVEGIQRELREETGLEVKALELIEVFERIFPDPDSQTDAQGRAARPQYRSEERRVGKECRL